MKTDKKTPTPPEWLDIAIPSEGMNVTNPYTGESHFLTPLELAIYSFIKGNEAQMHYQGDPFKPETRPQQERMAKGLQWFREHNAEAYMTLLD
tara:strand:- start:183 stop:461 length:279 start_codon:yes stop_codon:yes gene_type:complete